MKFLVGFIFVYSLLYGQETSKPPPRPPVTPEDLARGERLFMGHCAPCHGPQGDGGRGANLALPKLLRAPDDEALFTVVKEGISGTEMPAARQMIDREIWQVVAFVETLGQIAAEDVPGDPAAGQQLYRGKGNCVQCHTVNGQGGRQGPELTNVGARRSPAYLRQALLDPGAEVPENFLQVRVVTRDGQRVTGVRLNEDSFSIQVRDFSDNFRSVWKRDLKQLHKDRGESPMPSYGSILTADELDNLVAYLVSLRGE